MRSIEISSVSHHTDIGEHEFALEIGAPEIVGRQAFRQRRALRSAVAIGASAPPIQGGSTA